MWWLPAYGRSQVCTKTSGQQAGRIDAAFLGAHIDDPDQMFYVCGPDGFVRSINDELRNLGVQPDRLVYEQ